MCTRSPHPLITTATYLVALLTVSIIPLIQLSVKRDFRIFSSASTTTTVGELSAEPPGRLHSPPDINYYSRFYADYNRQNTQNREILRSNVCALCQLTNWLAGCIMEIRPKTRVAGPPIIAHFLWIVNRQNKQKIRLILVQSAE